MKLDQEELARKREKDTIEREAKEREIREKQKKKEEEERRRNAKKQAEIDRKLDD